MFAGACEVIYGIEKAIQCHRGDEVEIFLLLLINIGSERERDAKRAHTQRREHGIADDAKSKLA